MFKKIALLLCALALCHALAPVDAHVGDIPEDKVPIVTFKCTRNVDEIESQDEPGAAAITALEELPDEPGDGGQ